VCSFPAVQDGSALASVLGDETLLGDSIHGPTHAAHASMLLAASLQRAHQGSKTGNKAAGPRVKAAAPNIAAHQVRESKMLMGLL